MSLDLKGELTISKYHNGELVSISINDENGSLILKAEVSIKTFAEALFGLSHVDCNYLVNAENAGKRREVKEELIAMPDGMASYRMLTLEEKQKHLAQFESDGWKAYPNDLGNHHKKVGDKFRVSFTRFVDSK